MNKLAKIDKGGGFIDGEDLGGFKFAGKSLGDVTTGLVPYIITFAGIALLLYMLAGGLAYMTAAGDPKKMEGAKNKITGGLVGFFIVLFAFFVVQLFGEFLGLEPILDIFK